MMGSSSVSSAAAGEPLVSIPTARRRLRTRGGFGARRRLRARSEERGGDCARGASARGARSEAATARAQRGARWSKAALALAERGARRRLRGARCEVEQAGACARGARSEAATARAERGPLGRGPRISRLHVHVVESELEVAHSSPVVF